MPPCQTGAGCFTCNAPRVGPLRCSLTEEIIEAQRGKALCLGSHSQSMLVSRLPAQGSALQLSFLVEEETVGMGVPGGSWPLGSRRDLRHDILLLQMGDGSCSGSPVWDQDPCADCSCGGLHTPAFLSVVVGCACVLVSARPDRPLACWDLQGAGPQRWG